MRKSVPEISGGENPSTCSRDDPARLVALHHAQVAQPPAAQAGGAQRALDVG